MGNEVSRFDYAEPHPVLFKDSERREQKQMGNEVSRFDYAEPPLILSKDSER